MCDRKNMFGDKSAYFVQARIVQICHYHMYTFQPKKALFKNNRI